MTKAAKNTAPEPERPDVSAWAKELRTDFLQCRDFGHAWRPFVARWDPDERAYESVIRCSRCKTTRTRWISRTGEYVANPHYDYAPGYLASKPKGIGRLTAEDRNWLRLESILRVLPDDADES